MIKEFIDTIKLLDAQNQGSKLHNMKIENPWLLDKIEAFSQNEEAQLRDTLNEFREHISEINNFTDSKVATLYWLDINNKVLCLLDQIQIRVLYASLMKFPYKKSLEPNDKCNPGILLENQQRLKLLISKYKKNWKDMAPFVSVKIQRNSETDVEVNICHKQLRTHQDKQLIKQQIKFPI